MKTGNALKELRLVSMVVVLSLATSGWSQSTGGNSAGPESVTEDLSRGKTFTFAIGHESPTFTFRLIPEVQPPDEFGNAQSTIREVEVYSGRASEPLQRLTGCDLSDMDAPGRGAEFFVAEDVNFDGYRDIFLQTMHGA